jgi:hypothetical protein
MNEASAVIKLNKPEIENVIRALVLSIRVSKNFDLREDISSFIKVKDDFIKIKNQLEEKETEYKEVRDEEKTNRTGENLSCKNCE